MIKKEYTLHHKNTPVVDVNDRPVVPRLTPDDFVKAKYSHRDKKCYTARMLDVFLPIEGPMYPLAYRNLGYILWIIYTSNIVKIMPLQLQRDALVGIVLLKS